MQLQMMCSSDILILFFSVDVVTLILKILMNKAAMILKGKNDG